eukprot:NODE_3996_length_880_cov_3.717208_g3684_i0.p1 GENE.NODE_3996_length_880_cov_3.717208_g3684_i0~~NODE_3996_length_880_cov_3.717208_g3684_i0.p1  ORF type:complete len:242 (-),score=36.60 NODE_3996_length_880_cov_3.717208_g3684_i0:61-786(-)
MGSCASSELRSQATLRIVERGVSVERIDKESYVENYGFLQCDRYVASVILKPSETWVADHRDLMQLEFGTEPNIIDIRKYIAHKVAVINWLNQQAFAKNHYFLSIEDKEVAEMTVDVLRNSGRKDVQQVQLSIIIKGDADYMKCKLTCPEALKGVREVVGCAAPDWDVPTNGVRLLDGTGRRIGGANLDSEDLSPPRLEDFTPDMLQVEINRYYKRWFQAPGYTLLQSQLKYESEKRASKS